MDADKIKNFFLNHCEKMILSVVILGSGYMMYVGSQKPNFLETNQPEQLASRANSVKSDVDLNHNDNIIPERQPTFDIVSQTARLDTAVDPLDYSLPKTWTGKSPNSVVRRLDPELLPPESLIVRSVVTSIAIRGSRTEPDAYALAALEDADPVEKVEKPKKRERRTRGTGRGAGGEDMMMEMGGMEDMMMMEDMMSEMGEGLGGGSSSNRKFDSQHDLGMRPVATQDKANPEPAVGWFIAGSAVVPHRQLYEAYKQALQDADQYDPVETLRSTMTYRYSGRMSRTNQWSNWLMPTGPNCGIVLFTPSWQHTIGPDLLRRLCHPTTETKPSPCGFRRCC